jgi:hydrogenase maturation protein HypF
LPGQALDIRVKGVVQGVGFRPFVYQIARQLELNGRVFNTSGDVTIHLEGTAGGLQSFLQQLRENPPPRSRVESITTAAATFENLSGFAILESRVSQDEYQLISPDLATCPDCRAEIFDPADRRYRYPFTNCTNCGPRFTIIEDIPYDRPRTTMQQFTMCPDCRREYDDPFNRRFHAQPNACPVCGPRLELTDAGGRTLPVADVILKAAALLKAGQILAIKGLGGFLLACDATNQPAVMSLRERKHRPSKPLAVMLQDLSTVARYCQIDQTEIAALNSPAAPIVILKMKLDNGLAPSVAPGLFHLGVMLPYTPLHHILLRESGLPLVMTSGNLSEEPIAKDNPEALRRLGGIADYFILHNRDIHSRYDDSVVAVQQGLPRLLRRARGYAPYPVHLPFQSQSILACGPELKNTFCLTRDNHAFVSQHIGDLENLETLEHFENTLNLYQKLFRVQPQMIACDMHPDYLSTRWAHNEAHRLQVPLIAVQHHHAHIVSCMAENAVTRPVIGVALDGTGYGLDGHIWGGEFMLAGYQDFQRQAHLEYLPLPGGNLAIQKPYRIAIGYLYALLGATALTPDLACLKGLGEIELELIKTQVARRLNTPLTSSCGRLFDAVSALLGIRRRVDYEGQAAIELEVAARGNPSRAEYPYQIETLAETRVIRVADLLAAILADIRAGQAVSEIATRFHNSVLSIMLKIVSQLAAESGIKQVALSGGVFQNRRLFDGAVERLKEAGFQPLLHQHLPVNDGCISLGQAVVAHFSRNKS